MSSSFIDLARQCCDADEYLDMGYICATAGQCYNPLRPIGDTLWFAIPYTFGTSENIFFYLHLLLFALVGISVFYLVKKILPTCLFLCVLLFLTWPTFFYTLSDTPATLLFIEGLVLALLGLKGNRPMVFFAAGIALGLCALLRTAYFLPLLIACIPFLTHWLWQKNRQWAPVLILGFFIPLSFQFMSTWKHTGQWHFLSEGRSRNMMNLHLNSAAAGYDTYLPQTGALWSPDCAAQTGLLPSLKAADIASTVCILKNRFTFYLGSYAASAFLGPDVRNFFDNDRARKAISAGKNTQGYFVESKSLLPLPPGAYHYSVVLWSSQNHKAQMVDLQINNITITHATATSPASLVSKSVLSRSIIIADSAQQYAVDIHNDTPGYLVAYINSSAAFNVQAAALEPAASASGFVQSPQLANTIGQNTGLTKTNRIFSSAYLIINCLVAMCAAIYLFRLLAKTRSPAVLFIAALLFSVLIQCVIIIPEQRYMQGLLGACWLLCLLLLSDRRRHS